MAAPKKSKASGDPPPLYVVFGAEPFLRAQALARLLNGLLPPDAGDTVPSTYQGESAQLADVLDDCRTPSLLSANRVVLVRDADQFVTNFREELEKYVDSITKKDDKKDPDPGPPPGTLVLECRSWPKTTRLYKKVDALGGNIACEPPKRHELPAWLIRRAADEHGCRLSPEIANRLVELVGDHLGMLDMELAKLATYAHDRGEIRVEHVEDLVGATREELIFRVVDSIADRDAAAALARWDQVLATDRSAPYRAIGGLAWSIRRIADAKRLAQSGRSPFQERAFMDPGLLRKAMERYSLREWYDNVIKLLRIDLGAKTGLGDVGTAVEKLIVEMCAAR